jgi:hypothetical protein
LIFLGQFFLICSVSFVISQVFARILIRAILTRKESILIQCKEKRKKGRMDGSEGGEGSRREGSPPVVDLEEEARASAAAAAAAAVDEGRESPDSFHSSAGTPLVVDEAVEDAGAGPSSSQQGQDLSGGDELAGLLARLRMNPLLKARLEESLIEDGRALSSARAQGWSSSLLIFFENEISLVHWLQKKIYIFF